ncbi:MAG TPA: DNA primase [Candidatus Saccharimonadales bacterium]|nr:DNA primase [Candidatus Saccharimonadales bacterium]
MQDAKEEVRARLNIEDVVGEYVQLKRAGRNFKGISPFSGEKTPSFFVSPDKHIWHDFSSNKGGDVFSFVMEVEGMDFRQALEHLARKAGVDLSLYESKGSQDLAKRKKRLLQANDWAAQYYQHSLLKNQHAVEYVFKTRGLSKQIVQNFRIGYAPTDGRALTQFLTKKGFSKSELADSGLVNRFGGDLFRGRMTVPLMDAGGQVIGFTARILGGDDPNAPKYLNTPQTLLYDKSRHVFGLSQAKEAIRTNDYAVIVEGNLDVVSSHQVGVTQVVATAGTAMTEQHLRALKRLSGQVRLAFDADKAGIAATERAIPIASEVGVELTIISLPDGAKDPDELIQQDVTLWQAAINATEPAVDWILAQYSQREDITTASGKRAFTTAALNVVRHLQDPIEQEHYEKKIATMVGSSIEAVRAKLATVPTEATAAKRRPVAGSQGRAATDSAAYQDNLLSVALIDAPSQELFAGIDDTMFIGDERQAIARYLAQHAGAVVQTTPKDLQNFDTYVKILLLKAETRYADWNDQIRYHEVATLLRQVQNEHKKQKQQQLSIQLREAEAAGDDTRAAALLAQLNTLIKEITRGQR